ncbi:MAG: integral HD domain-containing protein [Bdellovibrionaceae bacterium]|nr:integral HD domain-containing protein [Pseudobdellovibrionaceae bacterium]|tara:strand:- start:13586 stop:14251 length:666 start_codon:yes stop_codon:yes gene_type:complete
MKGGTWMSFLDMPDWGHQFARSILTALREKDPYTYGHCLRVGRNARLLAQEAGYDEKQQTIIEFSALFHDIGKIGIPDSILLKPGKLSREEIEVMKKHPVQSAEMIRPFDSIGFFKSLLPGILYHHERVDGKGYPFCLSEKEIPTPAKIILIVDTFDAMTTSRPYRNGLNTEKALEEIIRCAGTQFDPDLAKLFVESFPQWNQYEEEITETFVSEHFKKSA